MVFNGLSHLLRVTVVQGVIRAHGALQLWKFTHHIGQQIGFGQLRRCQRLGLFCCRT